MNIQAVNAPAQPQEWDGEWRLIEWDPVTKISEWWLMHADAKTFTIRRIQHNIDAFLEENKAERNSNIGKRWGDGKKVATIPLTIFNKLGLDEAVANQDDKFLKKVLNNSDLKNFRTFEGNL